MLLQRCRLLFSSFFSQTKTTVTAVQCRPLSVPFLLRTSGKGTDTATMLRLEKYGRIDFSLGRWTTTDQNAPKSMRAHVKLSGELAKTKIRSLSRPQQPLFNRSSFRLHQNGVNLADITTNFTKKRYKYALKWPKCF